MSDAPCRTDLGPLTKRLLEQQQEIERLRAERDEARRWVCSMLENLSSVTKLGVPGNGTKYDFANEQGWNCYKENEYELIAPPPVPNSATGGTIEDDE